MSKYLNYFKTMKNPKFLSKIKCFQPTFYIETSFNAGNSIFECKHVDKAQNFVRQDQKDTHHPLGSNSMLNMVESCWLHEASCMPNEKFVSSSELSSELEPSRKRAKPGESHILTLLMTHEKETKIKQKNSAHMSEQLNITG